MKRLGTEVNQQPSTMYCKHCYHDGKFTDSEITFHNVKTRGLAIIYQLNTSVIKKHFMQLFYPGVLKRPTRWRKIK
ncbi:zinc ribbon domain-containing protein [Furfurilactobacillus rossiae]|jgi:hypothetical protein|nr:zinc ribbon domain-containing protein [Furfurilactobacillus milii]MCF6163810.1 zinc ribbon domain-containing protein [Furfurilactobacillus milii]MCF6419512.1 zinc ribbon domain-containing protein [Furfurilactobacillus milii]